MSHSKFSPSASYRWLECPGSIPLIELLPQIDESNIYSKLGTAAHSILERMVELETPNVKQVARGLNLDHLGVDLEKVSIAYKALRSFELSIDVRPIIEKRVRFSWAKDFFGTVDYSFEYEKKIVIIDFKFGSTPVYAKGNTQGLIYALMYCDEKGYDFRHKDLEIGILQPKRRQKIDFWTPSYDEKVRFMNELRYVHREIIEGKTMLKEGSHCKYCPAELACPIKV